MPRLRIAVAVPAVLMLVLSGCGGPAGSPSSTRTDTSTPSSAGTSSATTGGSTDAGPTAASPTTPAEPGDCTAADARTPATTYTVLADDATTAVTVAYTAFTVDGGTPIRTATVYGPVASIIVYACVPDVSGGLWSFTATATTTGALSCILGFGGRTVAGDSAYNEGALVPETVDCTGNPGR